MRAKYVKIGGARFRVQDDGRVWICRNKAKVKEIGTGLKTLYKKYFVKELGYTIYLHRLVAVAFVPNPNKKEQVMHLDGDKHNNDYRNLTWVNAREKTLANYARK